MKSIILEGLGWNSFVKSSQAYENQMLMAVTLLQQKDLTMLISSLT
jgi:hypothetical protein